MEFSHHLFRWFLLSETGFKIVILCLLWTVVVFQEREVCYESSVYGEMWTRGSSTPEGPTISLYLLPFSGWRTSSGILKYGNTSTKKYWQNSPDWCAASTAAWICFWFVVAAVCTLCVHQWLSGWRDRILCTAARRVQRNAWCPFAKSARQERPWAPWPTLICSFDSLCSPSWPPWVDSTMPYPPPHEDTPSVTEGCCWELSCRTVYTWISLCAIPVVVQRLRVWAMLPFRRSRGITKLAVGYVKRLNGRERTSFRSRGRIDLRRKDHTLNNHGS